MLRRHTGATRIDTLLPYTTLFRSLDKDELAAGRQAQNLVGAHERSAFNALQADDDHGGSPAMHNAWSKPSSRPRRTPDSPDEPRCRRLRSGPAWRLRSEEHTSELQSLMRISYAVFCLKKKIQ